MYKTTFCGHRIVLLTRTVEANGRNTKLPRRASIGAAALPQGQVGAKKQKIGARKQASRLKPLYSHTPITRCETRDD
jgi:hypothetical protein